MDELVAVEDRAREDREPVTVDEGGEAQELLLRRRAPERQLVTETDPIVGALIDTTSLITSAVNCICRDSATCFALRSRLADDLIKRV